MPAFVLLCGLFSRGFTGTGPQIRALLTRVLAPYLLFTVAYEMLGSAVDAEDVVQESWLRWADTDRAAVQDPRAYLVRIVTRKALDRLRTLAVVGRSTWASGCPSRC